MKTLVLFYLIFIDNSLTQTYILLGFIIFNHILRSWIIGYFLIVFLFILWTAVVVPDFPENSQENKYNPDQLLHIHIMFIDHNADYNCDTFA